MPTDVALLLAGSNESASLAMSAHHLTEENTATIQDSQYLLQANVLANETVYATSDCTNDMFGGLTNRINRDLKPGQSVCLVITRT